MAKTAGSLMGVRNGENSDVDYERRAADQEKGGDRPDFSYSGSVKSMGGTAEPSTATKPAGKGKPSREELLRNIERLQAKLKGGGPSINPDEILGRTPTMARPGMAGGPALPALNPMAQPTIDPSQYHGSDAAGPGMGGYRPSPYEQAAKQVAGDRLNQDADAMFKQLQTQREQQRQITPQAPTDDALYREMLKIYGGGG